MHTSIAILSVQKDQKIVIYPPTLQRFYRRASMVKGKDDETIEFKEATMVKVFHPRDVISTKTNIEPAKMQKTASNIDFLVRRTAREQRRSRRAL